MTKLASKGDKITCENGHEICTVAFDIYSRNTLSAKQFENWTSHSPYKIPPIPCDMILTQCATCDAQFMKCGPTGRWYMHVNGEWTYHRWADDNDKH